MNSSLKHRGPDSDGMWVHPNRNIGLVHSRLAVIDLSANGAQPMHSSNSRYVVTYNGEIYNCEEMRDQLKLLGHRFKGHSDTEVLLAAIVQWGLRNSLGRFIGMFAFALWDQHEQTLTLVRDRLGIKPLYYLQNDDCFLFASELRAIARHPSFNGNIDRRAVALYLQRNCFPAPWTVYDNVRKVPPATIVTFSTKNTGTKVESYWSLLEVVEQGLSNPFMGNQNDIVDELEAVLTDSVRQRMTADVPIGVFLSGGIDSSSIAALMQASSNKPIKTFSIGFKDARYDEANDASLIAQHLGTEHDELYLDEIDALSVVPKLSTIYDEPFADSSQIPTYLVSALARQKVTVVLSGDGGDEVFGGYNRYMWIKKLNQLFYWMPLRMRHLLATTIRFPPANFWDSFSTLLRQRTPGEKFNKLADLLCQVDEHHLYECLVSHWQDPSKVMRGIQPVNNLIGLRDKWPPSLGVAEQMMYLDTLTYLSDDILTKVDRASMAVGLEARVPILDHRVVAFAWRLPITAKLANGISKKPLRQMLERYVPNQLTQRPKMGFSVPIHAWMRGALKDWCENLIDEKRLSDEGLFDPGIVRQIWNEHLSGRSNRHHQLWDILMFQAWRDAIKA